MHRNEFYRAVAMEAGMTIKDTKKIFETGQKVLCDTLKKNEQVKLFDGIIFERVYREARSFRNPITGGTVSVSAKYVPKIKIGKAFKELIA